MLNKYTNEWKNYRPKAKRPFIATVLYARRAKSSVFIEGRCMGDHGWEDVQLAYDKDFGYVAATVPAGHKQPDKRNRYFNLNCAEYRIVWVCD